MSNIDSDKQEIITLFYNNVKGVEICLKNMNIKHCGKEGHWLETKMEIKHNSKNAADIYGYELKKCSSRYSLGDFSASEYAFSNKNKRTLINISNNWNDKIIMSKNDFIQIFGNQNPNKNNRYSWSGSCIPTYNNWNSNGQNLLINDNNDIIIYYSYSKDIRDIKETFPDYLKKDNIMIAIWKEEKMKEHINNKFNDKGFIICKKVNNKYEKLCFGKKFDFNYFIECVKNKTIYFDSGMYEGNRRNYSHFRANSNIFENLIIEEYS